MEHEVSIISAIQAIMSMDTEKYEVIPVYITKDGDMYIGEKTGDIEAYKNIPEHAEKIPEGDFCQRKWSGVHDSLPYEKVWEK